MAPHRCSAGRAPAATSRGGGLALLLLSGFAGFLCAKGEGAAAEAEAGCRGAAPAVADPGVVLIQRSPGGLSRRPPDAALTQAPNDPIVGVLPETVALAKLSTEIANLTSIVKAMQQSLEAKMASCCNRSCGGKGDDDGKEGKAPDTNSSVPPAIPQPGLCAAFGDPHFTTFDGGHTILLKAMTMWLVKSENVWVQGVSKEVVGNFMGFAVGGPFMQGHTFVLYNHTIVDPSYQGPLRALFDGKPILDAWDAQGHADFQEPFIIWAGRRTDWVPSMHDQAILEMKEPVRFSVGPWAERFNNTPTGGLYLFRFPQNIEVTVTGVDFMSLVLKMVKQPKGQTGYCGNFNGNADDDFEPPEPGKYPANLVPAWGQPEGEGLGAVEDEDNLFKRNNITKDVAFLEAQPQGRALGQIDKATSEAFCDDAAFRAKADVACANLPGDDHYKTCIFDVCKTGELSAAEGVVAAAILEELVNARGIPKFVGHGECRDLAAETYRALKTKGVRTPEGCQDELRKLSSTDGLVGVWGAQLRVEGTCEVLVDKDTNVLTHAAPPAQGGWGDNVADDTTDAKGTGGIVGFKEDLSWSCWRVN